jgi:hypothetical protein
VTDLSSWLKPNMDMELFYRVMRVNKEYEIPYSSLAAILNIGADHS